MKKGWGSGEIRPGATRALCNIYYYKLNPMLLFGHFADGLLYLIPVAGEYAFGGVDHRLVAPDAAENAPHTVSVEPSFCADLFDRSPGE